MMEFDAQSQCSDVGEDYSASENGEIFPSDYTNLEDNQPLFLEAKTIYLLLQNNVPVSRATRLQWLLDHLNTTVTPSQKLTDSFNNLEVISAIPREQNLTQCNRFLITYRTELKFLAKKYRFVYCLDMSPSNANVDIQKGEILFDEILNCFRASLEGLCREFTIPGNTIIFQPCIYLTVIVNTPFFMSPAQQVLVKGVLITQENLSEIIKYVETQFHLLEGKIADVSAASLDQLYMQRAQNEGLVGDLFDLPENSKMYARVPMVTPDINFVNMLRYSMLAITLLPEFSMSHILVITDGIAAMPDSNIMESLIYQLHYDSISLSFLKVGSSFHPHAGAGFVSYTDLLYFLAHSTLGTCLENFVHLKHEPSLSVNVYHELFLLWSFHSANKYACSKYCDNSRWTSSNDTFYIHKVPPLLSKRQTDDNTSASVSLLLARRLREGFTVDSIFYLNGNLEIKLILQWKSSIYVHYKVKSQWPALKNLTHFEVYTSAPYEFLHDLTCSLRKETKSMYRKCIMERFRMRLTQLQSADLRLDQYLSSFQNTKDWYTLPDSVKNGIPVFILNYPTECNKLSLTPSVSCPKFVNIWQPICQIETNNWRKWFHTHKVTLILRHDNPLPKYLHIANSSQRFQVVQCRQAAAVLYGMLSDWASFVLIDSHTYLKLLHQESEKPPQWFCILRVSSKFPCTVVNIGFTTGTPGDVRREVVNELKINISALFYSPSPFKVKANTCCILLQKPLEKILIRYERIPRSYSTVIFPDGTQPPSSPINLQSPVAGSLFTTLSRYLFHKRWIWSANLTSNPKLPDQSLARILNTLTKMRLKEGFNFAHSASGIITMAIELWMEPTATCIVQYVLFPPHCAWVSDEFFSESEDENDQSSDSEIELQMVTEVWIEPQYGKVVPSNSGIGYIDNKYYLEIAEAIRLVDMKCFSALLTLEHLSLMCQEKSLNITDSLHQLNQTVNSSRKNASRRSSRNSHFDSPCVPQRGFNTYPMICPRIEHIPFNFDPIGILNLCQQTELLFSMFIETKEKRLLMDSNADKANRLLLDNFLEHFGTLHDRELELTKEDSDRFTHEILLRHKNKHPHLCPVTESLSYKGYQKESEIETVSKWRCFIKGVSVTHVILTFIASTLDDLKMLLSSDPSSVPYFMECADIQERSPSMESNYSDVPINSINAICLPVYVFDCPLGRLVNSFVNTGEDVSPCNEDVYEDHRFKNTSFIREEYLKLKSEDNHEVQDGRDDTETDLVSVKQHCKTLVLTHSKCFTLSLFTALYMGVYVHNHDVQSAMDECEESMTEIDITEYLTTICGHIKQNKCDEIPLSEINRAYPCCELKQLHKLIKEKFFKTICSVFEPIPTNSEYYFHRNVRPVEPPDYQTVDSDDEVSDNLSEIIEFRVDRELSIYSEGPHLLQRMESDMIDVSDVNPLFLHLICTLRYDNGHVLNTSLRVIPTCLGELIQHIETTLKFLDKSKLQVTLDLLCLTLPADLECILNDYSNQGLRTTSFCSDGFQPSIGTMSDSSYNSQISEPLKHLTETQKKAVFSIQKEIKWLLQDEICTALLDNEHVTVDTLNHVMNHVTNSSPGRSSCILDTINLNFVYSSPQSYEKFDQEFSKLCITYSGYKLCKTGDLYYLAKDKNAVETKEETNSLSDDRNVVTIYDISKNSINNDHQRISNGKIPVPTDNNEYTSTTGSFEDQGSQLSEISSINENESAPDTDVGYDEDVSEGYDDCDWLVNLSNKRQHLPNFWLILKVFHDHVTVYFHCRFMDLPSVHVDNYIKIQRAICESVKDLCKRVNQLLLLQSLYETKTCDALLEPDDTNDICSSPISRNTSFTRLRSLEAFDDDYLMAYSSLSEASLDFKAGYFSCPVVWETHFVLHPRLKMGPGKSGISRGILALKYILDKFSVSNRNNMFVYRDNQNNVFYLRLHENIHYLNSKPMVTRSTDFESGTVSRSPSIASLPLGQKSLTQSQQSIISNVSIDIRPRVRSFGEKESKDNPNEDTLILKVHGITEAGPDVQHDLVQVLQKRLDDAVLECLSVMLARNSMCPLTPEDVHFIQKPFRPPEEIVRLTVQDFALNWLESFIHYLKQNLLLFLNIPKYTDSRSHYRFKDYPEYEDGNHLASEDNVFIYNQSQNPSSGSRGICCIALALITNQKSSTSITFENIFIGNNFQETVSSDIIKPEEGEFPDSYLEFRLWKQGRVNIENLSLKLKSAVSQATLDIVTEYFLLKPPLCIETDLTTDLKKPPIVNMADSDLDFTKEVEFNCVIDMNVDKRVNETVTQYTKHKCEQLVQRRKKTRQLLPNRAIMFEDSEKEKEYMKEKNQSLKSPKLNQYETGDDGKLRASYANYLPAWLEFGNTLNTPSIKKHKITMTSKHTPNIIIGELMNMIVETTKAFRCITHSNIKSVDEEIYLPTPVSNIIQKYIIISRNLEQWYQTVTMEDGNDYPDNINPISLKNTQKYVPAISNNIFIPRQKILWIAVDTDSITLYSYNWTKDNMDKLIVGSTNLGYWLCVRTAFLYSSINQKLGIFHNQPLTRKAFLIPNNPYSCIIGNSELITNFPKDHSHKKAQATYNLPATLEVFRDNYKIRNYISKDPVYTFTQEIRDIKAQEKKRRDEMKILHGMYQSRTSTVTIPQLFMLIQNARIVHYVHTPLLFLPKWRVKAASTRDHSLFPSQAFQIADKISSDEKDLWHTELCYGFFQEYRNYMQTLGFMPLQIDNPRNAGQGSSARDKSSHNNVFYIQKTILGGILIFTAEFKEPFFSTKLMAIECSRLQNISSRASINRFTLSFLDECDRVKILMHLHSFTYDYHLRCIYNYISGNTGVNKVCERYNLHQFLDDFMKYYNKAPNFARNLVHTDTITIKNLVSEGQQLYEYLLSNVSQYDFKVFEMDIWEGESEYVLVQMTSTPQVSYKDSQDQKHTDDFDITLVVYNLCTPYNPTDNVLHLRYYLILTSKREIYPKSEVEEKLGKFRTVSSTARSISTLDEMENSIEKCDNPTQIPAVGLDRDIISSGKHSQDSVSNGESSPSQHSNSLPYIELYQESVNYLGYYSSHEQLMQQLILDKANMIQKHIKDMVSKGMVHCRTHLLWNRLVSVQDTNGLTYDEFLELKNLAKLEHIYNSHPNLGPLLIQPLSWYQDLAKLLLGKYHEHHRRFNSPDGNIQHYVILHQRYFGAFMLLSLDLQTARGELYAAYREPQTQEDTDLCLAYQKSLIDGFVNCICYYLWSGMISG